MIADGKWRYALMADSYHTLIKVFAILICFSVIPLPSPAASADAKPILVVAPDGFPSGHVTPEGAACDLARAFIGHDVSLFTNTCIRIYSTGTSGSNYTAFLKTTIGSMRDEATRKTRSPDGPKAIGKVFAACHLSKTGPVSYGQTVFKFQDIMFVDVGVYLYNGNRALVRTLMIKDYNGKWYAHPVPSVSPLLSAGLNEEPKSTRDFSDAYRVQK